ncbi:MAG TPA: hypothetical protein PLV92_18545 [Pirellulaceae bacterium]|nr:hypothetical protein [Pirellulaceae bacterium]
MSEGDVTAGMKTLLLWGDTQSGKTTWLTTALMYTDALQRLTMIDWEKSAAGLEESGIRKRWLDLRDNRQTQSTTGAWRVDLHLRSGKLFRIQDIRGGDVRQDAMRWFRDTDGLLGIVEWGSERLAQQMAAVEAILPLIGTKPKGLAITKCERWLPEDEAAL